MDRARRVHEIWSWLPAFRAVAETQHLPTAAAQLHLTPSALSRSVRLLEDALGQPLFHRVGRNLRLSDAGEAFLAAVRDAMRVVDDGMASVRGGLLEGALVVAAPDALLTLVLDVAIGLRAAHPRLVVHVRQVPASETGPALLRGQLDVALVDSDGPHPRLTRTFLGSVTHALFVGHGHPLRGSKRVTTDELAVHPFVALDPARDGATDPWPAARTRTVALFVERSAIAADVCARGLHVAALPVSLGDARLFRLPVRLTLALPLFAVSRPTLLAGGKAEVFLAAVRARLASDADA
ncbi:MAG: LysR family transcriptional regulator [Deltaproteobacteria bacterium]|nr:LysR family transcriptional regulator [Deltaproteobacteria bacterium]